MAGFITFNHEPEQYLFGYVLRPGNAPATRAVLMSVYAAILALLGPATTA